MKKYLNGTIALVLAVTVSAFNVARNNEMASKKTDYTWHKFNAAGTAELSPAVTFFGTAAGAKTAFGCPDGTSVNCARAYDMSGTPLAIYVKKTAQ